MAARAGGGVVLIYMAAPVSAPTIEGIRANLARARRWLWWLRRTRPEDTIVAPWVLDIEVAIENGSSEAETRAAGLRDCCAIVERCDALALVGGVKSSGMTREANVMLAKGGQILYLLDLGQEPPEVA